MNKQNGSALIISLLMLLVMTLLGISSMSTSTLEEKMAANDRNQKVVFQSAESTLVDSEDEVINANWQSDINSKIIAANSDPYYKADETVPYYENATWADSNCNAATTNCYVVQLVGEQKPLTLDGGYGQADQSNRMHLKLNVTARSTDANGVSAAMVQSTVDKIDIPEI